jgi:hypothetical protein
MYNFNNFFELATAIMEAEQLNLISHRLTDLSQRNNALRGYL